MTFTSSLRVLFRLRNYVLPVFVLLLSGVGIDAQFANGTKVTLQADNGQWMSRCNGCQTSVNGALPDTITLSDSENATSIFEVVNDPSGKIMLKADTGFKIGYCNGCIVGGTVSDFIGVQTTNADNPFNKFELIKISGDRYALKAANGKYVARCNGCSPSYRTITGLSDVVTAHATQPGPHAQWTITAPGQGMAPFSLIFASDPQFYYCDDFHCSNHETQEVSVSTAKNNSHVASIASRINTLNNFRGVVINGDVTNTMDKDQLEAFETNYVNKFKVYPGLGNHDYVQYVDKFCRDDDSPATTNGGCFRRGIRAYAGWVRALGDARDFDWDDSTKWERKGSLAYWWDIGDYRFIQLNWNPVYTLDKSVYISNWVGNQNYSIISAMIWLTNVLNKSKDKIVILNMHGINVGDAFSATPGDRDYKVGYAQLQDLLSKYPNVGAIFAGHIHNWAGDHEYYLNNSITAATPPWPLGDSAIFRTNCGRRIPILFNGSAIYNLYLSVKFEKNKLTWTAIDSRDGNAKELRTDTVSFPLSNQCR